MRELDRLLLAARSGTTEDLDALAKGLERSGYGGRDPASELWAWAEDIDRRFVAYRTRHLRGKVVLDEVEVDGPLVWIVWSDLVSRRGQTKVRVLVWSMADLASDIGRQSLAAVAAWSLSRSRTARRNA